MKKDRLRLIFHVVGDRDPAGRPPLSFKRSAHLFKSLVADPPPGFLDSSSPGLCPGGGIRPYTGTGDIISPAQVLHKSEVSLCRLSQPVVHMHSMQMDPQLRRDPQQDHKQAQRIRPTGNTGRDRLSGICHFIVQDIFFHTGIELFSPGTSCFFPAFIHDRIRAPPACVLKMTALYICGIPCLWGLSWRAPPVFPGIETDAPYTLCMARPFYTKYFQATTVLTTVLL